MSLPSTGTGGTDDLVGPREHIQAGPARLRMGSDADILQVLQSLVALFRPLFSTGAQSTTSTAGETATTHGTSLPSMEASSDQADDDNDGSI